MNNTGRLGSLIFDQSIPFDQRCFELFAFQYEHNLIYRTFADTLSVKPGNLTSIHEIPLLPIEAFKRCKIVAGFHEKGSMTYFESSGTSGMERSRHYLADESIYQRAVITGFQKHFSLEQSVLACYMPGYRNNEHSSLIRMAEILTKQDTAGISRFIQSADDLRMLAEEAIDQDKKVLLFGAAFGLLDMLEEGDLTGIKQLEVIETGGMKTYRRQMSKKELRSTLCEGFKLSPDKIHSEYGMCELLSQMYAIGSEWFRFPHWMNVSIRKADDPLNVQTTGNEGKIGIIDFANLYSCPFILTEDRGVMNSSGLFRVLGRWNPENLRGCNFLIDDEI